MVHHPLPAQHKYTTPPRPPSTNIHTLHTQHKPSTIIHTQHSTTHSQHSTTNINTHSHNSNTVSKTKIISRLYSRVENKVAGAPKQEGRGVYFLASTSSKKKMV
uniref:Uncharacterized protein n=1 Tax=Cacopsylla melanoneura TaxID=428564 RepID=A0A8D8M040_9HEMI